LFGLQCDRLFCLLFLGPFEGAKAFDTSFFESAILFFKVLLISPESIKFLAVFKAILWGDFRNFLPKDF